MQRNAKFKAEVLYKGLTKNTTITLSNSIKNFDVIEIFYYDNDQVHSTIRFRRDAALIKMVSLHSVGDALICKYTQYRSNGDKQLTFEHSFQRTTNGDVTKNSVFHNIYLIVGYKYDIKII